MKRSMSSSCPHCTEINKNTEKKEYIYECRFTQNSEGHEVIRRGTPQPFRCYVCQVQSQECVESYYCSTCIQECHIGCYKFPSKIKEHPYHHHDPSHSLTLMITSSNSNPCIPNSSSDDKEITSPPDENIGGCKCCRRKLQDMYYACSICEFSLNATCAIDPRPPLTFKSPKIHAHETFTLFPRRISLPCDACGLLLNDDHDHAYTCLSRNYIAHGKCIQELPSEIWITRHSRRLSHTHSLPSAANCSRGPWDLVCRVCFKAIKVNYGKYSCMNNKCHYAVHSKCATRKDVWDGKELKGVVSEEDILPFKCIDEGKILHFSHEHHLEYVGKTNYLHDGSKFCHACLRLIIDSDELYHCTPCDFILHKECASLPRKIGHQLHKHRLTLLAVPSSLYLTQFEVFVQGMFKCSGCHQRGYGFMYQCDVKGCKFQVDAKCASISQIFKHPSHDHELFLSLTNGDCMRCGSSQCSPFYLECTAGCKFFLGFKCATLPFKAHYKYDGHPLDLCFGEKDTTSGQYWCEVCETTLKASEWFYTCDICKVTIHVDCLLGKEEVYMKPNHIIEINYNKVEIVRNKSMTRPFCSKCGDRCVDTLVFKGLDRFTLDKNKNKKDRYFCTLLCIKKYLDGEKREEEQK